MEQLYRFQHIIYSSCVRNDPFITRKRSSNVLQIDLTVLTVLWGARLHIEDFLT